jgi:hypothetical protein
METFGSAWTSNDSMKFQRAASSYQGLTTPRILAGAKWFLTFDLKTGYWQVALYPRDKEETPFYTGDRLWKFSYASWPLQHSGNV